MQTDKIISIEKPIGSMGFMGIYDNEEYNEDHEISVTTEIEECTTCHRDNCEDRYRKAWAIESGEMESWEMWFSDKPDIPCIGFQ
jgi:hypothetical protein